MTLFAMLKVVWMDLGVKGLRKSLDCGTGEGEKRSM